MPRPSLLLIFAMDHNHVSNDVATTIAVMAVGLVLLYAGFASFLRWKHGPAARAKKRKGATKASSA